MAGQQFVFAETVGAMKRALARHEDESDSDNSITRPTNRSNKLKRKAKYVQEGKLDLANGPRAYRRKLNYNGYERHVVSYNPPRVDFDGDVIVTDNEDEAAELSPAEDDPYADIRLEELLMPLTSAADLHTHPSLSKSYYSKDLDEMVQNAADMVRKEQAFLWKAKQLLVRFRGDETWIPCGMMETDHDIFVFGPKQMGATQHSSTIADADNTGVIAATWERISNGQQLDNIGPGASTDPRPHIVASDVVGAHHNDFLPTTASPHPNDSIISELKDSSDAKGNSAHSFDMDVEQRQQHEERDVASTASLAQRTAEVDQDDASNGRHDIAPLSALGGSVVIAEGEDSTEGIKMDRTDANPSQAEVNGESNTDQAGSDPEDDDDADGERPAHRMTTRARAHAATDNDPSDPVHSASPTPSIPFIHPFFSVPAQSLPDREYGLPAVEADKTRRLLMMYVQKQEDVCRGSLRLYKGLLKAMRMRTTVLHWSKAEGHVGELEDGEDWYDLEEWGLDEDLKKGEDQDDDDGIVGPSKKTRRARAAA